MTTLSGSTAHAQEAPIGSSPELQKLSFLVGTWKLQHNGAGTNAGTATVNETRTIAWIAGGRFLKMDSPVRDAGTFIFGYDVDARAYRLWRFGANDSTPAEWKGNFTGDKLVLAPISKQQTARPLIGLGLDQERTKEGYLRISRVSPGTSAAKAGVKVGDLITKIGDTSLAGMPDQQLEEQLSRSWPRGARVTLLTEGKARTVSLSAQRLAIRQIRQTFERRSKTELAWVRDEQIDGRYERASENVFVVGP